MNLKLKPFPTATGSNAPAKAFSLNVALKNKTATKRGDLYGTGITQREGEKLAREVEKTQAATTKLEVVPSISDLDGIINTQLPTTLVDADMQPDEYQQAAIDGLIDQQFGVMIGAAGTGKTTAMKWLIQRILDDVPGADIQFCAFTGRAVQQMKRALPLAFHNRCDTIHGMLEYAPEVVEYTDEAGNLATKRIFVPHRTRANLLSCNILIMDESGMTYIDLWNYVMEAAPENMRIYLLGDINQLPPVMGRSVLGFAMEAWPTFELQRIHRTDESSITDGAWDILHGKLPTSLEGKVALMRVKDGSSDAFNQTVAVIQKLSEAGKFNPLSDGLIVPQNVGPIGQEAINERLVPYFNPTRTVDGIPINPRTIITAGYNHVSFAVGDKIMVTANDRQKGLTNGMIGVIEGIIPNDTFKGDVFGDMAAAHLPEDAVMDLDKLDDLLDDMRQEDDDEEDEREIQSSHTLRVRFQNIEDAIEFASAGAVNSLRHAYAFTCHKSQGGEYPVVVILVHAANIKMLSREWLYTAWTRAQQKVVLLYNSRGIQHALNRQVIKGKTLAEKAACFRKWQDRSNMGDDSIKIPILPVAVEIAA